MDIPIISQRYAKALFDLAIELNKLEKVSKDMALVNEVTKENPEFKRLLTSPTIPEKKKNKVISSIFENHLDELSLKFLKLVTRKEREVFLEGITDAFVKLYKVHHKIMTIKLSSAIKMDEKIRKELIALLTKTTNHTIELIEEVDKSIIGGFVLTMEDKKYDASIRHQLEKLKRTFAKNLYVKGF